jgi:alpha-tubulin suppressor-like RCC1 family protein
MTGRPRAGRVIRADGTPLTNVIAVDAGGDHTCAATSDGSAWCWGNDWAGQLGDGTHESSRLRAVRVKRVDGTTLTGVVAVSAGVAHSCAVVRDGSAWCWGSNWDGQLGDGTRKNHRLRAVRVTKVGGEPLAGVIATSNGYCHSCARTRDGATWCWGANGSGQLGDGTTTGRSRAVRVTRGGGRALAGVVGVSAGHAHTCARQGTDAVWCWGANWDGQLGDGTTSDRHRAVRVAATWASMR